MALETAKINATKRGITALFKQEAKKSAPIYPSLCSTKPSVSADEEYVISGSQPGMREFLGDRVFEQLRSARFTLANKHWESSLEIDRVHYDDDRLGIYNDEIGELADEAMCHPDELLFDLIKLGNATNCYDGQYFFDTDHSWGSSGTLSNKVTGTVVATATPSAMELKTAFNNCVTRMKTFKKDNGKFWLRAHAPKLSNFVVVCPLGMGPAFDAAFEQKMSLEIVGSSAGATTNHIREKPTILEVPYLNGTETNGSDIKFYVFYVGGRQKPFIWQPRQKLKTQIKGLGDIETKTIKFMTEARYNVGYFLWQYAIECTLST